MVYCILGAMFLAGLPFLSVFASNTLYELFSGKPGSQLVEEHPHRIGFIAGLTLGAAIAIVALGTHLEAVFPDLGDTTGLMVCFVCGVIFAIAGPILWLRFLRQEDSYGAGAVEFDLDEDPAWTAACERRIRREWEITDPDPVLRESLAQMDEQLEAQGASLGRHATDR